MKILVLNGPNLHKLGTREPEVYGKTTLDDIIVMLKKKAERIGVEIDAVQSNEEGALVTAIGESSGKYDGILLNPAAYTHTSVALRDALQATAVPCVEVHLSNTHAREEFRKNNLTAAACVGQIMGFGAQSYLLALDALVGYLKKEGAENETAS